MCFMEHLVDILIILEERSKGRGKYFKLEEEVEVVIIDEEQKDVKAMAERILKEKPK